MKTILILLLFSAITFSQTKQDSTRLKQIIKDFKAIQSVYLSTDSLQLKRKGIMEYLQQQFIKEQRRLKNIKNKK